MSNMTAALSRYMDLSAEQMKVTASNLANVDTPGYKTKGFDFEHEFSNALHGAGTGTNRGGTAEPILGDVDGLVARPDGNTVSLDREALQLSKAQLQFRTGAELLKHEFSRTMSAIHAESK